MRMTTAMDRCLLHPTHTRSISRYRARREKYLGAGSGNFTTERSGHSWKARGLHPYLVC
jgi:hypothetical protein